MYGGIYSPALLSRLNGNVPNGSSRKIIFMTNADVIMRFLTLLGKNLNFVYNFVLNLDSTKDVGLVLLIRAICRRVIWTKLADKFTMLFVSKTELALSSTDCQVATGKLCSNSLI